MKIYIKKIIILAILLSMQIISCQGDRIDNERHNLLLNFKKGAKLNYISETKIKLNNIESIGSKQNIKNTILNYISNKNMANAELNIKGNFITTILGLYDDNSADIKTDTQNYIVNKIRVNRRPLSERVTSYNIPIFKTNSIKVRRDKKGKIVKIYQNNKISSRKLLERIISILNKYQHLPDKHITIGESWNNKVNEYIPLSWLIRKNKMPWIKGYIVIKLIIVNTFKKIQDNKTYINFKTKGVITLKLTTIDGKNDINIKLENGKGNIILNNKTGLVKLSNVINNIKLKLRLNHKSVNSILTADLKVIYKLYTMML